MSDVASLLKTALELAERAGEEILAINRSGRLDAIVKSDESPVTRADLRSNEIISAGLASASSIPIISEESPLPNGDWSQRAFWLVDPLDGTRDFVAGKDTYVVNIALIENGRPTLGVVRAPAFQTTYWATLGGGAFKDGHPIANPGGRAPLVALVSGTQSSERSVAFMKSIGVGEVQRMGSAIKFCLVADGTGDLYPRFGPTYEWDTAAGHAILNEAGCHLLAMDTGQPLAYGKPGFLNGGFVASRRDLDLAETLRREAYGKKR